MNKSAILSLIRHILSAAGAYLLGKSIFGHSIDNTILQGIIGGVMIVVGMVWSILEKTATVEAVQGAVRQLASGAGGFLVSLGKLTVEQSVEIVGALVALVPYIQSLLARKKNTQLSDEKINIQQLKK